MPSLLSARLRKTLAWLALCAMFFGAAAPTATWWLRGGELAGELIEICHGSGMTLVPASHVQWQDQAQGAPADQPQPPAAPSDNDGCPYCSLTHHWPYAPAASASFAPPVPPGPAPRLQAPAPAPVSREWHTPYQPRGPPQPA